jgi:carbon storage regulator CsrA
MIGDDIIVTVIRIDRGKVRLAFEAPRDVRIDREEVRLKDGYTPKKTK